MAEDVFLLSHYMIGADFIASHDFGRPDGAGSRRMRELRKTGADRAIARMMIAEIEANKLCGRIKSKYDQTTSSRWTSHWREIERDGAK